MRRGYPQGVIVHTDRGSQYCSKQYRNLIKANNLIGSMSRKGNCWDNAVAENFFGLIKREFLNHYTFETHASTNLGIVSLPVSAKYKKYPTILQNLAKQVATMS